MWVELEKIRKYNEDIVIFISVFMEKIGLTLAIYWTLNLGH